MHTLIDKTLGIIIHSFIFALKVYVTNVVINLIYVFIYIIGYYLRHAIAT